MQNVITQATASATSAINAAVVNNNDASAINDKPSIKLGANAKVKVAKVSATKATLVTPLDRLQSMETATRNWETTELAASNKRKYSIMTEAYAYYLTMKADPIKETRAQYAADLEKFIEQRKYVFSPSSHDMTRVVKCVFGTDRRRVSAYSIALREALNQKVSAKDLVDFIEQNGGVEQIRLGGTKPLSATLRAGKVKKGKGRDVNMRFQVMVNHFVFEAEFCNPASGWEKGQIEKNVQDSRHRLWQVAPVFASLDDLNDWLEKRCIELWSELSHPQHLFVGKSALLHARHFPW